MVDTKGKLAPKYVRGFVKIGNMKQGHVYPGKFDGSLQKNWYFADNPQIFGPTKPETLESSMLCVVDYP